MITAGHGSDQWTHTLVARLDRICEISTVNLCAERGEESLQSVGDRQRLLRSCSLTLLPACLSRHDRFPRDRFWWGHGGDGRAQILRRLGERGTPVRLAADVKLKGELTSSHPTKPGQV